MQSPSNGHRNGALRRSILDLRPDVRYALRGLSRAPTFTLVAVLTLALAIGATTAILTVVDVVLLRPLPYPDSERLYSLWGTTESFPQIQPSYPDFVDWRERTHNAQLGFALGDGFLYRDGELTEIVTGAMVSEGFLDVIGARPALGRGFAAEEERAGGAPVVLLSHSVWTRRFGQDRNVIGRAITLGETAYTVVGVLPAGASYPEWAQVMMPLGTAAVRDAFLTARGQRVDTRAIARVPDGVAPEAAEADLRMVAEQLAAEHPQTNRGLSLRLSPLREEVIGNVRTPLLVLLVAGALVLLIACANLASLLLARATGRMRELAVRRALGAEGTRIARQLLTESLVLAIAGGVLGVFLARILFDTLLRLGIAELPALGLDLPYLASVGLDARVLGLVAAVTVTTGLLFGAAPAALGASVAPARRLRGGAAAARGPAAARLHGALVVVQLALAVTLLAGAGLLLRSYAQLGRVDPGFRPENLTVLRIVPPQRYTDANARAELYERIAERAEAIPGVIATTLINHMPLTRALVVAELRVPGASQTDQPRNVAYRTVAQNFFTVAGVRLLRGRDFTTADFVRGSGAMVVNEALAAALWPDQDPLGRALTVLNPTPGSDRFGKPIDGVVVGVVGNTAQPRGADPLPAVYLPHRWEPWGNMNLVLRVERDPAAVVAAVRRAVLEIDDDLPVADVMPMPQVIRESLARDALNAHLMLGFAALALMLGVIGVYGVLSHMVAQRTREIGIRMAIGASRADVRRLVLGEAGRLIFIGIAIGLAGAYGLARLMESMLFGTAAMDGVTFVAVPLVLGAAALLATWAPAAKASRLEPSLVLRSD